MTAAAHSAAAHSAAAQAGPLPEDVTAACDAVGSARRGPMPACNH
ncbi:hypothetical protein [Streptomyces sp. CB02400]|nr:hypothetical protein [Streptomyces sp. CB02400]